MTEWWHSLNDAARVFWAIAIGATLVQILMFAASLIGGHDFDHSPDGSEVDSVEGVKLVSVRAIIAFLVGFGWAGGLMLNRGMMMLPAVGIALVTGLIFMMMIFLIMRGMMSLRDDGTMDYNNAVGQNGSVYVTIPAMRAGYGQVEVQIQGRITTVQAVTAHEAALAPQTPIVVNAIEPGNVLVVSPRF